MKNKDFEYGVICTDIAYCNNSMDLLSYLRNQNNRYKTYVIYSDDITIPKKLINSIKHVERFRIIYIKRHKAEYKGVVNIVKIINT